MNLRRSIVQLGALAITCASVFANGGAWQVGVPSTGNGAASKEKRSTHIEIEEERLTIDLHQEFAEIDVRYRMHNTGPKVLQDFFFPVERWSKEGTEEAGSPAPDLEGYRITADGAELKWRNVTNPEQPKPAADEELG